MARRAPARSTTTALLAVATGALLAGAAPASASPPAATVAAGPQPRLLGPRDVPGFRQDQRERPRRVTSASNRSCDTFGPVGATFSTATFTLAPTAGQAPGGVAPVALAEVLLVTRDPATARGTQQHVAQYLRHCFGDGALTPGTTTRAPTTSVSVGPAAHVPGASLASLVDLRGQASSVVSGHHVTERVRLRALAYQAGRTVVVLLPFRLAFSGDAANSTTTAESTPTLLAFARRVAPLAVLGASQ